MNEWRQGKHRGEHVYEDAGTGNHFDDRPVATFFRAEDAKDAVDAHNTIERTRAEIRAEVMARSLADLTDRMGKR